MMKLLRFILSMVARFFNKEQNHKEVSKYTEEQRELLARCKEAGIDCTLFDKPKYSSEQMKRLIVAKALNLDLNPILSPVLTPAEMDSYIFHLVGDYNLTNLANNEVASTIALPVIDTRELEELHNDLIERCKRRGIDYTELILSDKNTMMAKYQALEYDLIVHNKANIIRLKDLPNTVRFNPPIAHVKTRRKFEDHDEPCAMYNSNTKVGEYYSVNYNGMVYLVSKGLLTIELS